MTPEQGNKIIAEWMGGKSITFTDEFEPTYKTGIKIMGSFYPVDKLEFHSSWDWLMPVVEKIQSVYPKWYDVGLHTEVFYLQRALVNAEIEGVWQTVIDFIQWYNNQNKQ